MLRGLLMLVLSAGFWGLLSAWVISPGCLPLIEDVWRALGQPGWFGRLLILVLLAWTLAFAVFRMLRTKGRC